MMLVYRTEAGQNAEDCINAIEYAASQLLPLSCIRIDHAFNVAYVTIFQVPNTFTDVQALLGFGKHYYYRE
jgi:hypothetical protein